MPNSSAAHLAVATLIGVSLPMPLIRGTIVLLMLLASAGPLWLTFGPIMPVSDGGCGRWRSFRSRRASRAATARGFAFMPGCGPASCSASAL